MGQKVHPYGFRIGFNKTWRSRWYAEKKYAELLHEDLKLRAELKRRLGWEFNGMRLHELYFENLGGKGPLDPASRLGKALAAEFGLRASIEGGIEASRAAVDLAKARVPLACWPASGPRGRKRAPTSGRSS